MGRGLKSTRDRFAGLRRSWATLQEQNVPRLAAWFLGVTLCGGVSVFLIERRDNDRLESIGDSMWWAFVTLTTIGYGDRYPITAAGRALAVVVVLVGIGLVGTVTGKIASALVERRIKEGRGLSEAKGRRGHLVITGWKADLPELVEALLARHDGLSPEQIVLVNSAGELPNEELRVRFPGLLYVHGEPIDAAVLRRAHVAEARKVLVLADASGGRSDQEVDARTVMTVMSIENLAPSVYTCAEVLEGKHVDFLRLAHCDEIILSREYERALLVGTSVSSGLSEVMRTLLQPSSGGMQIEVIAEEFVGRLFGEFGSHIRQTRGGLLLGLLENTGQALAIKRDALRAAQKTDSVATLIENLRTVKDLVANRPILNPPDSYPIKPHSMAVIIGGPGERERWQ